MGYKVLKPSSLEIPPPELLDYPSKQAIRCFKGLTKKLEEKAKRAGEGSTAYKKQIAFLKDCAERGKDLVPEIKTGRDIRALIYLWNTDDSFTVTRLMLLRFREIRPKQGALALYNLTQVFFKFFEKCGDFDGLAKFLLSEYGKLERRSLVSEVAVIKKNCKILFHISGPDNIVKIALKNNKDLKEVLKESGVPIDRQGRFQDLCKQYYYIESVRNLSLGEESHLFAELVKKDVAESPYAGGPAIGHEIIRVLAEKAITLNKPIPDNWLKVILTIGGDPRVPVSAMNYRHWWSLLQKKYTDKVKQALSRFDLKLFLAALDEYRKRSNNEELLRMFPSRKRFLEGLFGQNLVGTTRLFVGNNARTFLNRNYEKKELPSFAKLIDPDKSIIYLQIGGLHMIEGSHSFSLWIFDHLPEDNDILNYSKNIYGVRELGLDLAEKYWHGKKWSSHTAELPHRIIHTPQNLKWQKKAIDAFKQHGVKINPEMVFNKQDYHQYKRLHGLT